MEAISAGNIEMSSHCEQPQSHTVSWLPLLNEINAEVSENLQLRDKNSSATGGEKVNVSVLHSLKGRIIRRLCLFGIVWNASSVASPRLQK